MELLEMHKDGTVIGGYWTALPAKAEPGTEIMEIYRQAH